MQVYQMVFTRCSEVVLDLHLTRALGTWEGPQNSGAQAISSSELPSCLTGMQTPHYAKKPLLANSWSGVPRTSKRLLISDLSETPPTYT